MFIQLLTVVSAFSMFENPVSQNMYNMSIYVCFLWFFFIYILYTF